VFLKWYGEELDINIKVPKILPSYVEKSDIEKLLEALKAKKSHRNTIERDILLVDLAIHSGLRRSELANLRVGDIDIERQVLVVRQGKGAKDRVIPLSTNMSGKLVAYMENKGKDDSLFGLAPASISGKIRAFATKAGVDIHTHSLRDYFATSLSEKGATIREIQSLLGHANLTHTERYTLHTDKHLKQAIELIDQEPGEAQITALEKQSGFTGDKQERSHPQPLVTIKGIYKSSNIDHTLVLKSDYFSHFVVCNEGQSPAIEVELTLLNEERDLLDAYRETVLGVGKELEFKPILKRPEGKYYIVCQYKHASYQNENETWDQTWLPFELSKASKEGEVYVAPGELEFKFGILNKDKLSIFTSKPK
jgi:hypothetical protein